MKLIDLHDVFVPFDSEKIEGCSIVYFNEALANGKCASYILNEYSFVIKNKMKAINDKSAVKTFMAERYGGNGILNNGGGSRCGFDGKWQLKGVGPNQLVGRNDDPAHSDGNLCLKTAIYESIWAEIIHAVLPFGATRTIAILDTGLKFNSDEVLTPRGLLVRQPVVRPAHFIRAINFKQKKINTLGEDAERVKATIKKLIEFLPGAGANTFEPTNLVERLQRGLSELACRYAEQFAAARAKHIIHYNVSASNLSIDGAWLDLSGTRLFTSLTNGDQTDINRFSTEHLFSAQALQNLCYYLGKYSIVTPEESLRLCKVTTHHFTRSYEIQLKIYRATQLGFPHWLIKKLSHTVEFFEFSKDLENLLKRDSFKISTLVNEMDWDGYEYWTASIYEKLLSRRVLSASCKKVERISTEKTDIDQLQLSYGTFFDLAAKTASQQHINMVNFTTCMTINVTRLNRSHSVLYNLERTIASIRGKGQAIQESAFKKLKADAVFAARINLANDNGTLTLFWLSHTTSIWFNPCSGMFTVLGKDNSTLPINALIELGNTEVEVRKALCFYRSLWSCQHEE